MGHQHISELDYLLKKKSFLKGEKKIFVEKEEEKDEEKGTSGRQLQKYVYIRSVAQCGIFVYVSTE